jgi:ubiquinone/menaquinone biosynthesis C-methylase UbiE
MIEEVRKKLESMGPRAQKATLVAGDIVHMESLASDQFALILAMGDPLSICSDPQRAANEFARIARSGGIVIATADNKLAAIDHFVQRGNLDALEDFLNSSRTQWLTQDERERFDLTTFTPATLRKFFERAGFEVLDITGKTILPIRENKKLLDHPNAVARLLKLEQDLAKDPASAGRAGHLQIAARKSAG